MTVKLQQEINQIVELKRGATQLDNLIQGYRLCARTEGKSDKAIRITTTALTTLRDLIRLFKSARVPCELVMLANLVLQTVGYQMRICCQMQSGYDTYSCV